MFIFSILSVYVFLNLFQLQSFLYKLLAANLSYFHVFSLNFF